MGDDDDAGALFVGNSGEKFHDLLTRIDALLENPNAEAPDTLFQQIKAFQDWGISDIKAYT